jgi:hypothetical protein
MTNLRESIIWQRFPIPADAAVGQLDLSVGQIGSSTPVGLVTAGVHGDEGPWGAWAIQKLLEHVTLDELQGTLRIVPVANPLAMAADARNAPLDGLDLNRVFPGDETGSHTERLAATLTAQAVADADVVIDLHGGGSWCVNSFAFQMSGGEALSRAFAAPFLVTAPDRAVTLTGYARSQGAQVAAVEMGGRSHLEERWADRIATGLRRALGIAGVLTPVETDELAEQSVEVSGTMVLRPSRGGVFIPRLRATDVGTLVERGTVLGHLHDPVTMNVLETFAAPFESTALLLLRPMMARLEGGAMTYVIAEPLQS